MNKTKEICPELQFLLSLSRVTFKESDLETVKSKIYSVKDWDYFLKMSNEHGVAALVYHNLDKSGLSAHLPAYITATLRNSFMISLSRNTFNTVTTLDVLKHLSKNNIRTVILKGMALENIAYKVPGIRQMNDVDILVDRKQCIRARKILLENGFTSLPVKSLFHIPILKYIGKHLPALIKNGASVEIHHELFGNEDNNLTKDLFNSSYIFEINGSQVFFPGNMLFFLYLVRHLVKHEACNESQLRLYIDLVVLLDNHGSEILGTDLREASQRAGLENHLGKYLGILNKYWSVKIPEELRDLVNNGFNGQAETEFINFLYSPGNNNPPHNSQNYSRVVRSMPGIHRKLLYILGDLFPTLKFMKRRYHCRSRITAFLYYPHRFGKLFWLMRTGR